MNGTVDLLPQMEEVQWFWWYYASLWNYIYYTLTLSIVISSTIATVLIQSNTVPKWIKTSVSLVAAISSAFLTTINPLERATNLQQAYLILREATERYKISSDKDQTKLIEARVTAETIKDRNFNLKPNLTK